MLWMIKQGVELDKCRTKSFGKMDNIYKNVQAKSKFKK